MVMYACVRSGDKFPVDEEQTYIISSVLNLFVHLSQTKTSFVKRPFPLPPN